jgi:hypothetical protein
MIKILIINLIPNFLSYFKTIHFFKEFLFSCFVISIGFLFNFFKQFIFNILFEVVEWLFYFYYLDSSRMYFDLMFKLLSLGYLYYSLFFFFHLAKLPKYHFTFPIFLPQSFNLLFCFPFIVNWVVDFKLQIFDFF